MGQLSYSEEQLRLAKLKERLVQAEVLQGHVLQCKKHR